MKNLKLSRTGALQLLVNKKHRSSRKNSSSHDDQIAHYVQLPKEFQGFLYFKVRSYPRVSSDKYVCLHVCAFRVGGIEEAMIEMSISLPGGGQSAASPVLFSFEIPESSFLSAKELKEIIREHLLKHIYHIPNQVRSFITYLPPQD